MSCVLEEHYKIGAIGRELWLKIKEKYDFGYEYSCLVIFPTANQNLNNAAIEGLPEFVERKYLKKVVLVFPKTFWEEVLTIKDCEVYREILTEEEIQQLLKYYRLLQFTKHIVVISMSLPYGNGNMVGINDITYHDYVSKGLYV